MPKFDLRSGIREPVVLLITRRQVESFDIASILDALRIMTASREDVWLYRGQMTLVVDGYNEDARALVDIPEARRILRTLVEQWKYWGFFFNQVDDSISILASCTCGSAYPGGGAVEIDIGEVQKLLEDAFDGMNELFDKHRFPENDLVQMSEGLANLIQNLLATD
jgi:hypothetical protein